MLLSSHLMSEMAMTADRLVIIGRGRLIAQAPMAEFLAAGSGDDVCGTPVPGGSMVAVLPYLVHRNPAVWPNPSGFDPGRFLPGAPERHRYAWIPGIWISGL